MTLKPSQIGIIGGGIAGFASAIALARLGAQITLFEQAPKIQEVGAGLQISANGFRVLQALGVDPEIKHRANRPQFTELFDFRSGNLIAKVAQNTDEEYPFLQCHRADLIDALRARAIDLGVTIELGHLANVIDPYQSPIRIQHNGSTIPFDAVIGADGMNSKTRQNWFDGCPAKFMKQVAWRATIPMPKPQINAKVYMGPHKHLVSYPLRGGTLLNIVAIKQQSKLTGQDWEQSGDPDILRKNFAEFHPDVRDILHHVTSANLWGLHALAPLQTWSRGNLVLVGDAAHPMLPSMAQGACMALEDAFVLAASLANLDTISSGFKQFERIRKNRTSAVQRLSKSNADIFHLANPTLRFGAQSALRILSWGGAARLEKRFDWVYKHDVVSGDIS